MKTRLINSFPILLSVFHFEIGIKFCQKKELDNRYCKNNFLSKIGYPQILQKCHLYILDTIWEMIPGHCIKVDFLYVP